jgi:hypothetical protein
MTITRLGPPGGRRTRLPEASGPIQGTIAGPHAGSPVQRRGRRYRARTGAAVTVAALDVPAGAFAAIVADAVGFCHLVADRVTPAGRDVSVTGGAARAAAVLAVATTLALD